MSKSKGLGKVLAMLIGATIVAVLCYWIIYPDLSPYWTGFSAHDTQIPRAKTLWDWMELLIIPIFLTATAIWFNNRTRNSEQKIASERLREDALQNYFERMMELFLKHNLSEANKNDDVRFISSALTLSICRQLDGFRKGIVLNFLYSLAVIRCKLGDEWSLDKPPIIALTGADLSELDVPGGAMSTATLAEVYLQNTDLSKANLYGVDLSQSVLVSAWLMDVNLESALLKGANLEMAVVKGNLKNADLSNANLKNALVKPKQLEKVKSLEGCIMPNGQIFDSQKPLALQCELELSKRTDPKVLDKTLA